MKNHFFLFVPKILFKPRHHETEIQLGYNLCSIEFPTVSVLTKEPETELSKSSLEDILL